MSPVRGKSFENDSVNMRTQRLHILYYNTRSLLSKIDELRIVCKATKPDILCIVETWLDNNITDKELMPLNYKLLRRDRNRHGGDVAICIR